MLNRPDLRHTNVYAEVRGKYARQTFNHAKITEFSKNPFNENPLLSRPTTSGSLIPRNMIAINSAHKRSQTNGEDYSIIEKNPNQKPVLHHRSISSKAGNRIVLGDGRNEDQTNSKNKKEPGSGETNKKIVKEINISKEEDSIKAKEDKNELDQSIKTTEVPQDDIELDSNEDDDEDIDQVNQLPDLDIKSQDYSSQYSSASQKRIMELENLLKEERMKREKLEVSMKKFILDKSK